MMFEYEKKTANKYDDLFAVLDHMTSNELLIINGSFHSETPRSKNASLFFKKIF